MSTNIPQDSSHGHPYTHYDRRTGSASRAHIKLPPRLSQVHHTEGFPAPRRHLDNAWSHANAGSQPQTTPRPKLSEPKLNGVFSSPFDPFEDHAPYAPTIYGGKFRNDWIFPGLDLTQQHAISSVSSTGPYATNATREDDTRSSDSSSNYETIYTSDDASTTSTAVSSLTSKSQHHFNLQETSHPGIGTSRTPHRSAPNYAITHMMVLHDLDILDRDGVEYLVKCFINDCIRGGVDAAIRVALAVEAIIRALKTWRPSDALEVGSNTSSVTVDMFKEYWKADGLWKLDAQDLQNIGDTSSDLQGTTIAALIGALFTVGIVHANVVHDCLDFLVEGVVCDHHLAAMYAIVRHANEEMYNSDNKCKTVVFLRKLTRESPYTRTFIWGTNPRSNTIRREIMLITDQWKMKQKSKHSNSRP